MAKGQSTITEVHDYIREHYQVGDSVTLHDLRTLLPWLKDTNISSALNKLEKESRVEVGPKRLHIEGCSHPFTEYIFNDEMFTERKRTIKNAPHTRNIPVGKKHCAKRVFQQDTPPTKSASKRLKKLNGKGANSELKSIIELLLIVAERLETYVDAEG